MSDEIKLTLEPETAVPAAPDTAVAFAAEEAIAEAEAVVKQVKEDAAKSEQFTEAEQKTIDEFAKTIDVTDSNLVFSYGAAAQQNISQFSDAALDNIKVKDLDEIGTAIAELVTELRGFSTDEEESKGFLGLFKKSRSNIATLRAKFDDTEVNVNKIVELLEGHQVQLLKDISMLDRLYEQNLKYFKELSMYIAAGKQRLEDFRATTVKDAYDKAERSGLPEDAQAAKDLNDKADRFEKKIYDLELTRNISIQMAPQIRMIQASNQLMAEKIQTSIVNTIPLWKSQMVLALGISHTAKAMEAQRTVTDLTNDLLKKNAEKLHMATVESQKEAERGIIDIETLKDTNKMLMDTMDEVLTIQKQGKERRHNAEKELADIEDQLRRKILSINE